MSKTPKQRVPLRLDAELAVWADAYAAERGSTRTAVYEAALRSFREDSGRSVPGLESALGGGDASSIEPANAASQGSSLPASSRAPKLPPGVKTASQLHDELMLLRQDRLNKGRGKRG